MTNGDPGCDPLCPNVLPVCISHRVGVWQATAVSLALKLPVLPAKLRRKGFENTIGNASNSPQRFDPLFWMTNND
jgi:hypothetical protein